MFEDITTYARLDLRVQQSGDGPGIGLETRWRSAGRSYSISFTLRQSSLACPPHVAASV